MVKRNFVGILLATFLSILFYASTTTAQTGEAGEALVDRVLAIVNGRPIFFSDIRRKIQIGPLVVVSEYPADKDAAAQTRALNDAINLELILGAAKDFDIDVSDDELNQEIDRHLSEQKLSKDKLVEMLKNEGETLENYRRDFRNQLVLRNFQRRIIAPSIKVTDKDVETYYLSQSGASANDLVEVGIRQILIKIDPSMHKELANAKRELADEIYTKLKGGLDFVDAIGLYSDDPNAKKPDQKPMAIKLKDLTPALKAAIDPLKPGDVTSPISTPRGLMIFQLVERRLGENRDYSAQKDRLMQELRMLELVNQTAKWLSEQHQRVMVKRMDV
jgi:peptidyl-prolyl cis-trans isomerase SurA